MSDERNGPRVELSCHGCRFHQQHREYDAEADEVDYTHDCTHPDHRVYLGYHARPPLTCPLIPEAVKPFLES